MEAFKNRDIDRFFEPKAINNIPDMELEELKQLKDKIEEVEAELSFQRRLLQGRLDILKALKSGELQGDKLVDMLPSILSDKVDDTEIKRGKMEKLWLKNFPGRRKTEQLIEDLTPITTVNISDDALNKLLIEAEEEEKRLSSTRRGLHKLLDAIRGELGIRIVPTQ